MGREVGAPFLSWHMKLGFSSPTSLQVKLGWATPSQGYPSLLYYYYYYFFMISDLDIQWKLIWLSYDSVKLLLSSPSLSSIYLFW